jgi:hypothetical protein
MSQIDKRRLVFAIIQYLNREMASDEMSEDAKESLEVASQCLQTAFRWTRGSMLRSQFSAKKI